MRSMDTQKDGGGAGGKSDYPVFKVVAVLCACVAIGFGVAWGVAFHKNEMSSHAHDDACLSPLAPLSVTVTSGGSSTPFSVSPSSPLSLDLKFMGADGAAITPSSFVAAHDSLLHVIAVGSDFSTFTHVHPEEVPGYAASSSSDSFSVIVPLEESGLYLLGIDGEVSDYALSKRAWITGTGGSSSLASASWPSESKVSTKVSPVAFSAGGPIGLCDLNSLNPSSNYPAHYLTVTLTGLPSRILAGSTYSVVFNVVDQSTMPGHSMPVTDMSPFFGAAAHIAVVREGLSSFAHVHSSSTAPTSAAVEGGDPHAGHRRMGEGHDGMDMGTTEDLFGPNLYADLRFDTEGWYMLVLQFVSDGNFFPATFKLLVE